MMERGEASVQKYILATRQFCKKAWIKDYWYCEAPKRGHSAIIHIILLCSKQVRTELQFRTLRASFLCKKFCLHNFIHACKERERGGGVGQLGTDILPCEKISELEDGALPPTTSWAGVRSSMLLGCVGWDVNTANFLGVRRRLGPGHC
jgi:hypothetical protein